ncbi:MAG: alkaline phosphatase family protein [Planctomycetota bacterium]|jgi:predicted AlkP superfamily phosphohydrolase/phosphomutase
MAKHDMKRSKMRNNSKLVLIGLDGAAFHLLHPLVNAGVMPTVARFLRDGASGTLLSTHPAVTCPAWPTMFTGVNPGKHGVFSFTCRNDGRRRPHTASLLDVRAPTLWELLGNVGYRVGVMNVPITFPAQPVNGLMVSGFPAPHGVPELVWPREEYAEMLRNLPDFTVNWPGLGERACSESEKASLVESVNEWLRVRIRTFEYFLDRYEVDFCFLVFEYTDKVQHWLYPLVASTADASLTHHASKVLALLQDGYRQIDAEIRRLVERFGENTNYVIVSDHGFGPVGRVVYLNHLLEQYDLFTPRRIKALMAKAASKARLPLRMRSRLGLAQDEPWHRLNTWKSPLTNFTRTTAFAGHQYEQAIYINAAGRCPQGVVPQGPEYEYVRRKVIDVLRKAKDPKTGKHIFEDVWAREEIYMGEHVQDAPDVIFELAPGYVVSPGIGFSAVLEAGILRDTRESDVKGYHRPDGVFVGYGPAFHSTSNVKATLCDVAPTVLGLMGVAQPAEMDGRIIEEAIQPEALTTSYKATQSPIQSSGRLADSPFSLSDEKEIAQRLAELGYL